MAHYGLSAAVTAKTLAKRDSSIEAAVLQWIHDVIGEGPVPEGAVYEEILKDGVLLCKLINKIAPGSVDKINQTGEKFKLMENIDKFIKGAVNYGVKHDKLFRTVDLFEKKNIPEVTGGLIHFARAVNDKGWEGPKLDKWVFAAN